MITQQVTWKFSQALCICHDLQIPCSSTMPRKILYQVMNEVGLAWDRSDQFWRRLWYYDGVPF